MVTIPVPVVAPLDDQQLARINPVEKDLEITIPLRGYPHPDQTVPPDRPIYLEAAGGIYTTGLLRAAYAALSWPYDYAAQVDAGRTAGWTDNSSSSHLSANLTGGYIIGDGYGLFSGGHMGARADYGGSAYRLYGVTAAPERAVGSYGASLVGSNSYQGWTYDAKAEYSALTLRDSASTSETSLNGKVKVSTHLSGFLLEGGLDMRLTYLGGNSISFGALSESAGYSTSLFSVKVGTVLGIGGRTEGETSILLTPLAECRLYPLRGVTLAAAISGGLSQTTLRNVLATNPYVARQFAVKPESESISYSASLRLEPSRAFTFHVTAARSNYDDYLYFQQPTAGQFQPAYDKATVTRVTGDLYWTIDTRNELTTNVTFVEGELGSARTALPEVPKWDAGLIYARRLEGLPVKVTGSMRYIGDRSMPGGTTGIPVYLLGIEGSYLISNQLELYAEFRNLLNQHYELWSGYQERQIFGALGIRAHL
jgi:hypothetical protein